MWPCKRVFRPPEGLQPAGWGHCLRPVLCSLVSGFWPPEQCRAWMGSLAWGRSLIQSAGGSHSHGVCASLALASLQAGPLCRLQGLWLVWWLPFSSGMVLNTFQYHECQVVGWSFSLGTSLTSCSMPSVNVVFKGGVLTSVLTRRL